MLNEKIGGQIQEKLKMKIKVTWAERVGTEVYSEDRRKITDSSRNLKETNIYIVVIILKK